MAKPLKAAAQVELEVEEWVVLHPCSKLYSQLRLMDKAARIWRRRACVLYSTPCIRPALKQKSVPPNLGCSKKFLLRTVIYEMTILAFYDKLTPLIVSQNYVQKATLTSLLPLQRFSAKATHDYH